MHMKKRMIFLWLMCCVAFQVWAAHQPEFSTAGFFAMENTGRSVMSMNPGWRFFKGAQTGAEAYDFDDSSWERAALPHGIEYVPTEASGCVNYQGEVWYRKHFSVPEGLEGKRLFLHFEAIMGKSKVFVNGKMLATHYGGYLPVIVDVTDYLETERENVIAVWADNSNDPTYPPGKPQEMLDYTYFGGIYRDCWLVAHNEVYITDSNYEEVTAGGGLFVSFGKVSETMAEVRLQAHLRNASARRFKGQLQYVLRNKEGETVASTQLPVSLAAGKARTSEKVLTVNTPKLWSPASPYLYQLEVRVMNPAGEVVDGYRKRVGIRSFEFKGKDGFWLNGKPYTRPLIGANRHQDFAILGNAVPNSIHWRDAKKLKDTGMEVIRNAHCPQDPAFMDACDELGLLVIDNTPGWQFWNDAPIFAERVYSDIRNLVRRDRNHPCVWMWEPILNETWYPVDFAKYVRQLVETEYPHPYCFSGSDSGARGNEYYDIHFAHPSSQTRATQEEHPERSFFTREWGDNVDNWSSHNSPSRVARNWGEEPMRVQAEHYAKPYYNVTCMDMLYQSAPQHIGGCLWHSFDHQRGYHPDPFYGGLMDVFRQPKYSYYMFMAQRPAVVDTNLIAQSGPMVYIAHEMTPFSGKDVTVYSNCDEVRLTFNKGGKVLTYTKDKHRVGMPSPIIRFKDVYDFMEDKRITRNGHPEDVYLLAEGLIDGTVVATHKVTPARRADQILLWLDDEGTGLQADGSDVVTVVAAIADKEGCIKRLNNDYVRFSIEGEGRLLGGADIMANPAPVKWGTAPVLVQSTLHPGTITVRAEVLLKGSQKPISGELKFQSRPSERINIYKVTEVEGKAKQQTKVGEAESTEHLRKELESVRQKLRRYELKEVEQQQTDFGE